MRRAQGQHEAAAGRAQLNDVTHLYLAVQMTRHAAFARLTGLGVPPLVPYRDAVAKAMVLSGSAGQRVGPRQFAFSSCHYFQRDVLSWQVVGQLATVDGLEAKSEHVLGMEASLGNPEGPPTRPGALPLGHHWVAFDVAQERTVPYRATDRVVGIGRNQLVEITAEFAVVLVSNLSQDQDIAREPLLKSPRRLWTAWGHPLAECDTVSLADVAQVDFVQLDMDEHVDTMRRYWARYGLEPKVVFRSRSIEAVRSLVAKNLGVTILSDLVYRQWSHDGGRIRRRTLTDEVPSMDLGLAYLKAAVMALTPPAAALSELLRASARNLLGDQASRLAGPGPGDGT